MTTISNPPGSGGGDNEGEIAGLTRVVEQNNANVAALQENLVNYPTKAETDARIAANDRKWRRRITLMAVAFLLLFIPSVVGNVVSIIGVQKNDSTLNAIKTATGPEAQKRSAASIDAVVERVDCNQRRVENESLAIRSLPTLTLPAYCAKYPPLEKTDGG